MSNQLRQVIVPFLNQSHCEQEYPGDIDDTMLCAGREGVDSCQVRVLVHNIVSNANYAAKIIHHVTD